MAIARCRTIGPTYHLNHKIGENWVYDTGRKRWLFASNIYCQNSNLWQVRNKMCVDETHPGPPWKDGGPLFIKELYNPPFHTDSYTVTSPNGVYQYRGCFVHRTRMFNTAYTSAEPMSDLGVTYGATGWNRFRPVKSGANLAQFIGELRDFGSLFRQRLRNYCDGGSAYLNYQFGWKPFLSDVNKFLTSVQKVERTIDFVRRNNNKWLKRGGTIKKTTDVGTEDSIPCAVYPALNVYYHLTHPIASSPTIYNTQTEEHVWFRARMKYWIPSLKIDKCENVWTSPLLRRIYGLDVSPATLWELTPWSWFVDWFGNIGDVIANLSSLSYDHLTAKYAYVMRSEVKTTFFRTNLLFSDKEGNSPIKVHSSEVLSTKQRMEASPFGFHLGWDDLSSYQLSILAALGLSRMA